MGKSGGSDTPSLWQNASNAARAVVSEATLSGALVATDSASSSYGRSQLEFRGAGTGAAAHIGARSGESDVAAVPRDAGLGGHSAVSAPPHDTRREG